MNAKSNKGYERIGLKVTAFSEMGNRKYMEDVYSVAYQKTNDGNELDFAYFGMFDGHGGATAALFAKNHLMNFIVDQPGFWSNDDEDVLKAIKCGFIECHMAMWKDLDNWPQTSSGLPSTAGTTASIAFIRKGKLYIGHAGDSGIVLGSQSSENDKTWEAIPLTVDHKPENLEERKRIESCGGKVIEKMGIHRVVWYRPKFPHQGPIRRNTRIEEIPFLAVARSLGDLWSYNWRTDKFMVSPEPDVAVYEINNLEHKCLIFASDGLWNIMDPQMAVDLVFEAETSNQENAKLANKSAAKWLNPSRHLVDIALQRWRDNKMRSDNTSVVTVMLEDVPNRRNNFEPEQNSRTIYDYSTSEAYNLDYMNTYDQQDTYNNLVMQNSFPYFNNYAGNQLPSFSSSNYYGESSSSSADLTYHTNSNECAFVKGCCPNERFLLRTKLDEQIHYHATYDQHKQMYQTMAQQPFPPLHYTYRPVINQSFGFSLPSINDGGFLQQNQQAGFMSPRPMERYNYLRPTEAEMAEMHNYEEEPEEEEEVPDTDTEEMEWSDDEENGGDEDEKVAVLNIEPMACGDEIVMRQEDSNCEEVTEKPKTSDDSIQIFEISSSSNIDTKASSKSKLQQVDRGSNNNKENSETPIKKKKTATIASRYYATRQTDRKMRSSMVRTRAVQKATSRENSQRRIVKCAKRAVKAVQDIKTSTSVVVRKLESLAMVKSTAVINSKQQGIAKSNSNLQQKESRILRSSQTSPHVKKAMKEKVFKVDVIRNLRSSAIGGEKMPKRKIQQK